ncbi:MAG TPA: hypothetical protein VFZ11_00250 [Gemmatimonadaceae bacterium]
MHRAPYTALVLAAAALAACAPSRPSTPRPSPTTPVPLPEIEERVDARGFRWRAGALTYEVSSEATIDVRGDTIAADTIRVDALLTVRIDTAGAPDAPLPVAGTVDAYEVRSSRPGGAPADTLTLPIPFAGLLGPAGLALQSDSAARAGAGHLALTTPADVETQGVAPNRPPSALDAIGRDSATRAGTPRADAAPLDSAGAFVERPCAAPLSAPVALARDLLLLPPSQLAVGTTWSDSTVTTVCRGEVPVTTTAIRRFTVLGSARVGGGETVAIERTSAITIAGSAQLRGRTVAVSGTGTGRTTFYASVERGALLGADGSYETDLTIESGTRRQQFTQTASQRVRLRGVD